MVANFGDLSLNMDELQAQIEEESRFPGELVKSEFGVSTGDFIRRQWQLEWRKLIDDPGFTFKSSHNLPDPNRPVINRRRMSYVEQVKAFAVLGIRGNSPEDFLGVRCWVQESVTPGGQPQFDKRWWKPVAKYVEGEPFPGETSMENTQAAIISDENDIPGPENDEDKTRQHILDLIHGKTQRQAITALAKDSIVATMPEILTQARNGTLFDELIEADLITEEGGLFQVKAK